MLVSMANPCYSALDEFGVIPPKIGSHISLESHVNNRPNAASKATKNGVPHKAVVVTGTAEKQYRILLEGILGAVGLNNGKLRLITRFQIESGYVHPSFGQHTCGVARAASDFIDMLPRMMVFHPFDEHTGRAEEDTVVMGRVFNVGKGSNGAAT